MSVVALVSAALLGSPAPQEAPLLESAFRGQPFVCTQGHEQPGGSHESGNPVTRYAVDLASPLDSDPATIHAARPGKAFVFDECVVPVDAEVWNDRCGSGFGNHVGVLSEDGVLVVYAHLVDVKVDDGAVVAVGDELGIEGNSGAAGHRHLHLSVHLADESQLDEFGEQGIPAPSVPFRLRVANRILRSDEIECFHNDAANARTYP